MRSQRITAEAYKYIICLSQPNQESPLVDLNVFLTPPVRGSLLLLLALAGMEAKSKAAQHSTGYLAGAFAEAVHAKHLVLTHFSARYSFVQASDRRSQVRGVWAGGGD